MGDRDKHGSPAVAVLKACQCYGYQACELNNYELSVAARIIGAIMSRAISMLPDYHAARWEIV